MYGNESGQFIGIFLKLIFALAGGLAIGFFLKFVFGSFKKSKPSYNNEESHAVENISGLFYFILVVIRFVIRVVAFIPLSLFAIFRKEPPPSLLGERKKESEEPSKSEIDEYHV